MEKAIFISKIRNLGYVTEKYSRLYFGNEFCERLIPSMEDLIYVLEFVDGKRMNFTLVTPYLTNKGIETIKPFIKLVGGRKPDSEIVINDWGLLRLLNKEYPNLNLVLGRLLTKQKRGPRILNLIDRIPLNMIQHFRESNVDVPLLSNFLINKGIKRIELDNLLQGIARKDPQINASLYIPFAYVTTTRFCLASSCENNFMALRVISPCNAECQKYTFKLRHRQMPVGLFLKGNTQFFKNERLPENLRQLMIDRIVYQPEIPI